MTTGSRLHFGLLDVASPFGGVGVMIDSPQTRVTVRPDGRFRCSAKYEARIVPIVQRIRRWKGLTELPPCFVEVEQAAPSHFGLGSGTQISLAVAEGICRCLGLQVQPDVLISELASRGRRSAVGAHGYLSGGLIYERGKEDAVLNPTEQRIGIPKEWMVVVIRPAGNPDTVSGDMEGDKFASLPQVEPEAAQVLRQLVTGGILPGAKRKDFALFSTSVQQYNEQSGRLFESVQGGPYNGPEVTEIVRWLRGEGVVGVGQSSWGPGVFAWCESESEANALSDRLPTGFDLLAVAHARNQPRLLDELS